MAYGTLSKHVWGGQDDAAWGVAVLQRELAEMRTGLRALMDMVGAGKDSLVDTGEMEAESSVMG